MRVRYYSGGNICILKNCKLSLKMTYSFLNILLHSLSIYFRIRSFELFCRRKRGKKKSFGAKSSQYDDNELRYDGTYFFLISLMILGTEMNVHHSEFNIQLSSKGTVAFVISCYENTDDHMLQLVLDSVYLATPIQLTAVFFPAYKDRTGIRHMLQPCVF